MLERLLDSDNSGHNTALAAKAGSCRFKSSAAKKTRKEAATECSLPLVSCKERKLVSPHYSLNTKTRVWPAKRTSFTCPVSLMSTES